MTRGTLKQYRNLGARKNISAAPFADELFFPGWGAGVERWNFK